MAHLSDRQKAELVRQHQDGVPWTRFAEHSGVAVRTLRRWAPQCLEATRPGAGTGTAKRPQGLACLDYLREGDTLVVRRLDRIADSETMAIQAISELHDRGINIKSLTEPNIDTTTPMGRALFGILAVFAQLRVDTIRENTQPGLAHARAQGRVGGRPSVMTPERTEQALNMRAQGHSIQRIATVLGVGSSSVSRALDRAAEDAKLDGTQLSA
ncbi:resolvase [Pseudoclavibacter sp. RFBI5]|uniref:recombinase family protein n=1 Tax=Pseudoclavibacter sp. RFBI5 TaxID=2080578 RepID=UPI000CE9315B|nr:recombinase family protein [Pseudoclavibacter sp. RFBI5]PPG00864.1 resolvase [Pseudoclavibacter sp. RFBI5]